MTDATVAAGLAGVEFKEGKEMALQEMAAAAAIRHTPYAIRHTPYAMGVQEGRWRIQW